MMMFRQPPNKFRSTSSSFNGQKMMDSTSSSFGRVRHTSGSFRSTSYSSIKNTQGKLGGLKDQLAYVTKDIDSIRQTTKEAHLYLRFMRQDLTDRRLPQIQDDLKKQIQALKKTINIGNRSDKLRYDSIKDNIKQLQKHSRVIKGDLIELNRRMDGIQNSLGFYTAHEKHRF